MRQSDMAEAEPEGVFRAQLLIEADVVKILIRGDRRGGGEVGSGEACGVLRRIETLRQLLHGRIDQGLRQRAAGKRIAQELAGVGRVGAGAERIVDRHAQIA